MNPPETPLGDQKHNFDDTFSAFDAVKAHLGIVTDDGPRHIDSPETEAYLRKKIKEFNDKTKAQYHLDCLGIAMFSGLTCITAVTASLVAMYPY